MASTTIRALTSRMSFGELFVGPQGAQHRVLSLQHHVHVLRVRRVALHNAQVRVPHLELRGVAHERRDFVSRLECAFRQGAPDLARRAEHHEFHAATPVSADAC
ncbi:MAG: hypothetical protein HC933_15985 [Pleurocapsa sp. SU_196_0]|nr:hypothetical protein [Pleurocapsa sp. SU_196_0]